MVLEKSAAALRLELDPEASTPSSTRSSWLGDAARVVLVLAAYAAIASFSGFEIDRLAGAETAYLARVVFAVLAAVAFLAPAPARELGFGAALATTAAWVLPRGPLRASTVLAILVGALTLAAWRRVADEPRWLAPGGAVALAFGLQSLLRGRLLFGDALLQPKTLVALVALPLASGLAASWLSRRRGAESAALALAAVALLAPGWNVAATLALAAIALGDLAGDATRPIWLRAACLGAILLPLLWEPRAAAIGALAALTSAVIAATAAISPISTGLPGSTRPPIARPAVLLGAAALALAGTMAPIRPTAETVEELLRFALILPAFWIPLRSRVDGERLFAVAAVAIAAARLVPGPAALAAPIALALLVVGPRAVATPVHRAWLSILGAGTILLAAYPWLRAAPLPESLALFGLAPSGPVALGVAVLAGGIALLFAQQGRGERAAWLVAGLAGLAALLGLPPAGRTLLPSEVALTAAAPRYETALAATGPIHAVALDSHLENSLALGAGTPVAEIHLLDASGRPIGKGFPLRLGVETAEWASERADLQALHVAAPGPWLSFVAGDFFGRQYRALWPVETASRPARIRVERAAGLPPDVAIAIHQIEVRGGVE